MKKRKIFLQRFADADVADGDVVSENTGIDDGVTAQNESAAENADGDAVDKIVAAPEVDEDADRLLRYIKREKMRRTFEKRLREGKAKDAYEELKIQAELLSKKIGGFDIEKELGNKKFSAMLRSGLTVEEAWNASHFDELVGAAVEEAKENARREVMAELRRGSARPTENGAVGKAAVQSRSVEDLTGKGIREILRRVEKGAKIKF